MAHIVAILGEIQSVSAFASQTYPIHGAEDTLAAAVKMKSGAVGVINFTFVSALIIFSLRCSDMLVPKDCLTKRHHDSAGGNKEGTRYIRDHWIQGNLASV